MTYTYKTNFSNPAASVSSEMTKVDFERWPPGGQKVGQMAVSFGVRVTIAERYLHTILEVPRPKDDETCHPC